MYGIEGMLIYEELRVAVPDGNSARLLHVAGVEAGGGEADVNVSRDVGRTGPA